MKQYIQADPQAATPWLTGSAHKLEKPVALTVGVPRYLPGPRRPDSHRRVLVAPGYLRQPG